MDEAGMALLRSIDATMKELIQEVRRQNDATGELARRKKLGSDREAKRRAKLRQNDATPWRHNGATSQVVKAVAFAVKEQKQEQKQENYLQNDAMLTPQRSVTPRPKPATGQVWLAYSKAYSAKYGAEPVRNAKVNGQLTQLVKRLGDEAAEVAAFYVGHAAAFYGQKGHAIGPLLADAEKLRTEWATGKQITATGARQREKTAANAEGWSSLLKEPKNGLG